MWQKSVLLVFIFVGYLIVSSHEINSAPVKSGERENPGITYYVDTNGSDSNDGSVHKPWRSLHYAVSRVKAGDTVLINPGKYIETKQISIKTSGEKAKQITFRGNGNGVIIDLTGLSDKNGFEVYFASYITIENLTVHASRHKHSRGIRLTNSNGSIIRNNIVHGAGHANLFCSLSDYSTFEENESYGGDIGIYVSDSSDYVTVKRNLLHDNLSKGLHMNGDRHSGGDGTISYATVESNIISNNGVTGINCDGVTKSVFRNNLLYDNKKRGIAFFKNNGAVPSNDNYVIHNTIVMPRGAYYAIGLNYGSFRNIFYNNIFFSEGNVPCFSTTSSQNELKIISDYNLFSKHSRVGEIKDKGISLRKWRNLGYDKHSLQGTMAEIFVNPKANNFKLNAAGPAIDAGTSSQSFGLDLLGNVRPGERPDMGAYEFEVSKKYMIEGESKKNRKHSAFPRKITLEANTNDPLSGIQKDKKSKQAFATVDQKRLTNSLGMEFVFIPPGAFIMGIVAGADEESENAIPHEVTLTEGFYMQTTEVTQGQWKAVMGENPSFFKECGDDCPVEQVSWNKVQQFCKQLNRIERTDKYRLPTEAEWEYACRAGTKTPFFFGKCLTTEQANYNGNYPFVGCQKRLYRKKPLPVRAFPSNVWNLSGTHGNVWEWCADWFDDYTGDTVTDPLGPPTGSLHVIRGGGWNSYASSCRSGNRSGAEADKWFANLGFRLVK